MLIVPTIVLLSSRDKGKTWTLLFVSGLLLVKRVVSCGTLIWYLACVFQSAFEMKELSSDSVMSLCFFLLGGSLFNASSRTYSQKASTAHSKTSCFSLITLDTDVIGNLKEANSAEFH